MNIKYEKLSVVGKVWTLAQTLGAGTLTDKKGYVLSAVKNLEELSASYEVDASMTVNETICTILDHAQAIKEKFFNKQAKVDTEFVHNDDIISDIWANSILLINLKYKFKNKQLSEEDINLIEELYNNVRHIFIVELVEKRLESKEKRDLFKIKEEVEDFKIKVENAIKHNLI